MSLHVSHLFVTNDFIIRGQGRHGWKEHIIENPTTDGALIAITSHFMPLAQRKMVLTVEQKVRAAAWAITYDNDRELRDRWIGWRGPI